MRHTDISTVLVVIPAHDEEAGIRACLTSVARAVQEVGRRRPGVRVGVTVVADRCRDGTVARATASRVADVVVTDAGSVGAARAVGVAAAVRAVDLVEPVDAEGVLVVNTDADCRVPASWLVEHLVLATSADVVLGEVVPEPAQMGAAAMAVWRRRHPAGPGSLHAANLSVRLTAYTAAGGFAPVDRQEDVLLVRRLREQGAAFVGGTCVTTSARRVGRVADGFAAYLRGLDAELAADHPAGPGTSPLPVAVVGEP